MKFFDKLIDWFYAVKLMLSLFVERDWWGYDYPASFEKLRFCWQVASIVWEVPT